ncbi:MAG: precorrin-6A reductase [Firmicutes bacterium]|nr:precorrin-6A reductase [Bacillota bacterium]
MILVIAGTLEGREVATCLSQAGYAVLATTTTEYGAKLIGPGDFLEVRAEGLTPEGLTELVQERGIRLVVDASHPFATAVSHLAVEVCRQLGIGYLRLERPSSCLPAHPLIYRVCSWTAAVELAGQLGDTIFLTIGTRHLADFMTGTRAGKRLVVRVLPNAEAIRTCAELGIPGSDIIAMQGPFSRELNRAIFQAYGADVIVTKESGDAGGVESKVSAALDLGLPVVVVNRPALNYPHVVYSVPAVLEWLRRSEQDEDCSGGSRSR